MNNKRFILCVLLVCLCMTSVFAGGWNVSTASEWAQDGITDAFIEQLVPYTLENVDYKENITRAQFASLVVKLYETMTKENVLPAPEDAFKDTKDTDVRKAKTLGIMNGSEGMAKPNDLVTREAMAAMYYRTLDKAYTRLGDSIIRPDSMLAMNDESLVSSWFVEAVDYVHENKIMNGSNGNFNPSANAPIEQAIIVVKRLYDANLDLVNGTRFVDLTKGFIAASGNFDKEMDIKFLANEKLKKVLATDNTSLKIIAQDHNNNMIYYVETYDESSGANGRVVFAYDIAKNEKINLSEYLGFKVSNVALIESGNYSGHVLVYPFEDSVFVYNHEFTKITELEGMVTPANANELIKEKLEAPIVDDYTQGYEIVTSEEGRIAIRFNNSNNLVNIVSPEEDGTRAPNPIYMGKSPIKSKDGSKLYFLAKQNLGFANPYTAIAYDLENKTYKQIGQSMSVDIKSFHVFNLSLSRRPGNTDFIVLDSGSTHHSVYTSNNDFISHNVYDLNEDHVSDVIEAVDYPGFKMIKRGILVTTLNHGYTLYGQGFWDLTENYAKVAMTGSGPTYCSFTTKLNTTSNDATYVTKMRVDSDDKVFGNSGIIFNVQSTGIGNDMYEGYYAGVDLYNNEVVVGISDYKWKRLATFDLSKSIKKGDEIKLTVARYGSDIHVYVNDKKAGTVKDDTLMSGGGFGFRSWRSAARYYEMVVSPAEI